MRKKGDRVPVEDEDAPIPAPIVHDNVRGGDYYATGSDVTVHVHDDDDDQLHFRLEPQSQPQPQLEPDHARRTDLPKMMDMKLTAMAATFRDLLRDAPGNQPK